MDIVHACSPGYDTVLTLAGTRRPEVVMSRFLIEPHFRLQEWVAEEKGYFRSEGLDYEFQEFVRSTNGQHHAARK